MQAGNQRRGLGQRNYLKQACASFMFCLAATAISQAQTFTTLISFDCNLDGCYPLDGLVQGVDGNLYGTANGGGAYGGGTVFKITTGGTLTTLYSFCQLNNCPDGDQPYAGLVQASNGDFYGTTSVGGTYGFGYGTVFSIVPSGKLSTIYSFCSQNNCVDGFYPTAGLVQASNSDFYGATAEGGQYAGGTVFKMTAGGTLKTLYSFCALSNCSDGMDPGTALVQASNGNLYGTTSAGGSTLCAGGCGVIYSTTPTGKLQTIYSFCAQSGCSDGYTPSGLIQATDGNFYGVTYAGGANGYGTVFKITSSGKLKTLYSFCSQSGCTDGANPDAPLVQATDGNFYGTTSGGGVQGPCTVHDVGCGTIFRITPGGVLTTLHDFCSQTGCPDGQDSILAGLVQDTNGGLYGATNRGGANNEGVVFALSLQGLRPFVKIQPASGNVGAAINILGTNLIGATSVTFNGTAATFSVKSKSLITTSVPAGATTGPVKVVAPGGTLTSNMPFRVVQ